MFCVFMFQCIACHESCALCSSPGALGCVSCVSGLQLYKERHQCVPCCSDKHADTCCVCNKKGEEMFHTFKFISSFQLTFEQLIAIVQ